MQPGPTSLITHFAGVPDPRISPAKRHKLLDIIIIAICAIICGADTWVDVALFGQAKRKWFATFLELPAGIPAHDAFGRMFAKLDPDAFQKSFIAWTAALAHLTSGRLVNIDGKTSRHSYDKARGRGAIHMVSAWVSANRLVLGATKVDSKSNEITAIPELLKLIEVTGGIVTIDAMGCQQDIAEEIIAQGADYVLAVKGNQGNLYRDIMGLFNQAPLPAHSFTQATGAGHGRDEVRYCSVITDPALLATIRGKDAWKNLGSVVRVTNVRRVGKDRRTVAERFFISSLITDAKQMLQAIRGHWGVENSLHWVLDIAFREDESRVRKDHGPENFAIMRHIALNLLKQDLVTQAGIKAKRLLAGWDEEYLLGLLMR
jgi:predicted transposase YbfD/YdcC